MHTFQHSAYQWQWIVGGVFAASTNKLLVCVTVVATLLKSTGQIDEVRNLVGLIAGASEPSTEDGVSNPYMYWSAVTI